MADDKLSLQELVDSSVFFLAEQAAQSSLPLFFGYSGGKDSIVTRELLKISGAAFEGYYSCTGIDPPEVVQFIRREAPEIHFLRPKKSFFASVVTRNPPGMHSRWCCTTLKKDPSSSIRLPMRVLGIRAEESNRRSKYSKINYIAKYRQTALYPILDWPEWAVWEFIEGCGLSYPTLYDVGFDRLGCVVCPYHSGKDAARHAKYRELCPGMFKAWEHSVKRWFDRRVSQGRTMAHANAEAFLFDWYRGPTRWYAKEVVDGT